MKVPTNRLKMLLIALQESKEDAAEELANICGELLSLRSQVAELKKKVKRK